MVFSLRVKIAVNDLLPSLLVLRVQNGPHACLGKVTVELGLKRRRLLLESSPNRQPRGRLLEYVVGDRLRDILV